METGHGHKHKMLVCLCEFLGTALFLFGIIQTCIPITIPISLLASVVIWGDITGGHFNPAVTIGVFTQLGDYGKNFLFMIMIIVSQILGGFFAMFLAFLGSYHKPDTMVPVLAPMNMTYDPVGPDDATKNGGEYGMDLNVVINEILCTFIFVSVILMVKGEHTAGERTGISAAIAVVMTLMCCIGGTNKLGACFNPAVGLTLTTNSIVMLGSAHFRYHYLYAYTLGPALGGLCAGLFHIFHREHHKPNKHISYDSNTKVDNLHDY